MSLKEDISGIVSWKSPSNIALVKYWGKYGRQLPSNPSISLTLSNAHTITTIKYQYKASRNEGNIRFKFEGQEKPAFRDKIVKFLAGIHDVFPMIQHLDLDIESENSFPHSSGIASSASSMSALAMCLLSIESQVLKNPGIDYRKASVIARLGSGSACRSVFGPIAVWGESSDIKGSSNDFAISYNNDIDPVFSNFHDDILIVSSKEKEVSSRAGHALMDNNPYAAVRFQQAREHMSGIISAMQDGNLEKFGDILEKEALTLHALMMASDPPYILMEKNTLEIIRQIQAFRHNTGLPVYFTLDAGPNIHLLYPDRIKNELEIFEKDLLNYCDNGLIIRDQVGPGPQQLI
ncbi:MAG: diphosphomevalonate decarboxylase [Bacteroidia bacterium]|nr:diphosphomevalonate decarboxylase [Bacteroidia bacterium]